MFYLKNIFIFSIENGQLREPALCQLYRHTAHIVPRFPSLVMSGGEAFNEGQLWEADTIGIGRCCAKIQNTIAFTSKQRSEAKVPLACGAVLHQSVIATPPAIVRLD